MLAPSVAELRFLVELDLAVPLPKSSGRVKSKNQKFFAVMRKLSIGKRLR